MGREHLRAREREVNWREEQQQCGDMLRHTAQRPAEERLKWGPGSTGGGATLGKLEAENGQKQRHRRLEPGADGRSGARVTVAWCKWLEPGTVATEQQRKWPEQGAGSWSITPVAGEQRGPGRVGASA